MANEEEIKTEETAEEAAETEAETETDKLKKELATQKDQFLRLAAEYDNYRKRTEKEKLSTYENATAATVEAFLPVADNFALAMASNVDISDDFRKVSFGDMPCGKVLTGSFLIWAQH